MLVALLSALWAFMQPQIYYFFKVLLSLQGYWPCQLSSGWLRSAEMLELSEEIYGPYLEPRCAEAKC